MAGAVLLTGVAGCGLLGGNKGAVCEESLTAVKQYVAEIRGVSADDPAKWKQAGDRLAGRFDSLAKKADDKRLRRTLSTQAAQLRAAGTSVGSGDVAALNKTLTDMPKNVGDACA